MSDNRRELGPDETIQRGDVYHSYWDGEEINISEKYFGKTVMDFRGHTKCIIYRPAPPEVPEPSAPEVMSASWPHRNDKGELADAEWTLGITIDKLHDLEKELADWRGLCEKMAKALKAASNTLLLMSEMIEDNDLKEDCLRTRKTVEDKIASFEKMTGKKP